MQLAIALSEDKDIFRGITLFEKQMTHNTPDIDLVSNNENFGLIVHSFSAFFQPNRILTSIKGCNSVANLLNLKLYNKRRACQ